MIVAAASTISDSLVNDHGRDALRSGQRRRSWEAKFADAAPPPMGRWLGVKAAPMSQGRVRGFAFMLLLYNGF
jgi:hypothetical protein